MFNSLEYEVYGLDFIALLGNLSLVRECIFDEGHCQLFLVLGCPGLEEGVVSYEVGLVLELLLEYVFHRSVVEFPVHDDEIGGLV